MNMLKYAAFLLILMFFSFNEVNDNPRIVKMDTESVKSIRIALQTWSFNKFTFDEAVQFAAELGFENIEMYPGQQIKKGSDDDTDFSMSLQNRELIKTILENKKLKLVQYGVVTCDSKEDWIRLFEFARDMGIETINSEPDFKDFTLLDSLTQAYKINLAVHNHANPTRYWDPHTVLNQIKDKNPRIGACPDNGHWMRSGLDPVESLKKLEGHVIAMHVKDMNEFNNLDAHTVPFGTGVLKADLLIAELKRQKFKGVLTIEYEYNWDRPNEDIKKSFENLKSKL
jgi:sugar phosphate isomerase/epimerase